MRDAPHSKCLARGTPSLNVGHYLVVILTDLHQLL